MNARTIDDMRARCVTKKEIMIPEVSDTRHVGSKKDSIVLKQT